MLLARMVAIVLVETRASVVAVSVILGPPPPRDGAPRRHVPLHNAGPHLALRDVAQETVPYQDRKEPRDAGGAASQKLVDAVRPEERIPHGLGTAF